MVNSVNTNYQQYYNTVNAVKPCNVNSSAKTVPSYVSHPASSIPFNAAAPVTGLRTVLVADDEKKKYNELTKILDRNSRKELDNLLKRGILLNSASNDKTTVLDNLYKTACTPRAEGLDNKVLTKDLIRTLSDPHVITQQFGDIPKGYREEALRANNGNQDIDVLHSGTCVAASIEYSMASKMPAEFARFVEGISSSRKCVDKEIKLNNLADNTLDAVWLLNAFEVPYHMDGFDKAKLTFAPDKNAFVRAKIQTTHKDPLERSTVDVLMQSTFMQVGSQQSYNALTDKRKGKFNQNDKGLIEFEKTFTESVVEDKNIISMTYQKVDENAKLIGYETDLNTMKRQITDALALGENVIIGYTQTDANNIIINGHEITIIGTKQDKDGKLIFICNDTDNNLTQPIEYKEDYLLPKIHHAALPQSVVQNDISLVPNWMEGINSYKQMKTEAQSKAA